MEENGDSKLLKGKEQESNKPESDKEDNDDSVIEKEDDDNDNDNDNPHESNIEKKRKKTRKQRRSKQFVDGRTFICILCKKAYLSRPALHNHQKMKHQFEEFQNLPISCFEQNQWNVPSKKRGRPPKIFQSHLIQIDNYFNHPKRKASENQLLNKVTEELIDEPFKDFLSFVAIKTSNVCYSFVESILLSFHAYLYLGSEEGLLKENSKEGISQFYDSIPTKCNDFLRYYKTTEGAVKEKDQKFEMIEMIYIFCIWLLEKDYTTAKLEYVHFSQ